MSKQIGRRVEAAIQLESSRGVGILPSFALGKINFTLFDKTTDVRDNTSIGRIEDSNDKFVVEKYAQGSMSGILGANSAAYLLALVFGGTPTVGSPSNSRYPWDIPFANTNQHKSASLLVKDADGIFLHKLVMINKFELTIKSDDAVMWSADFIAKRAVATAHTMPAYVEDYKFTKRKAKIYLAAAVGSLSAATRLSLKQFKLTITKNLVRDGSIGTVEPEDVLNQAFSLEGELALNAVDQTYHDLMLAGTYKALRLAMESEKAITGTTYGDVTLDLAKVDFFGWEKDPALEDIVQQTINFKGNYDLTTAALMYLCTVRNALSVL